MSQSRFILPITLCIFVGIAPAQKGGGAAAHQEAAGNGQIDALKQVIAAAEAELKTKAQAAAVDLATIAKDIDRNILSETPDPELDRELRAKLISAVTEVVRLAIAAKLAAVWEIGKLLTPEQKKLLLAELEKPGANPDLSELVQRTIINQK
jgi:hypothetical protein